MRPLALAALALLVAGCDVLDPMLRQPKMKPYRESDFWADGVSMRPPPEGTIPTEYAVAPDVRTGRNPDGTPVARIPVPVTRALLDTGRKRFEIVCGTCHGLVGDGRSLVARNMSLRPPPSLLDPPVPARTDGYLFAVATEGFGLMPGYVAELSVEDRWAVVAYLRALQLSQRARIEDAPPDERSRLEKETR